MKLFTSRLTIYIILLIIVLLLSLNKTESFLPAKNVNQGKIETQMPGHFQTSTPSASKPLLNNDSRPATTGSPLVMGTKTEGFCLNVPVLLYHHIKPYEQAKKDGQLSLTVDNNVFETQMAYLNSHGYKTISADQLAQALINHQQLPAKSVVITIDDGYSDAYAYVFPIARQYNVTVNLMIPTGLMTNSNYLTWEQLKEMVGSGLVFAYDHTWSHASLGTASKEKIEYEILTAKKQLEENLGKTVNIFTYPYGSRNSLVEGILRQNSFIAAFSTAHGSTQCTSSIMDLHRTHIGSVSLSNYGF